MTTAYLYRDHHVDHSTTIRQYFTGALFPLADVVQWSTKRKDAEEMELSFAQQVRRCMVGKPPIGVEIVK